MTLLTLTKKNSTMKFLKKNKPKISANRYKKNKLAHLMIPSLWEINQKTKIKKTHLSLKKQKKKN